MTSGILRSVILVVAAMISGASMASVRADESSDLLVFISAFATGDDGAIHACRLNLTSGELTLTHRSTDVQNPFFTALSPDRRFLYSIHAPGQFGGDTNEQVAAYEVQGRSGKLRLLNRQSAEGTAACYLDVDATGRTVVVANYSTGSVAALPVQPDGSLGSATTFVQHRGSSVDRSRQEGPHAHCIVVSPNNRFAYAADLGLDQVLGYRLNPATGGLSPGVQPFVRTPPAAGPRHLTFHANGKSLYVINELSNSVTGFTWDAESGILLEQQTISTLPADFTGTSYCADLKITPDGRYLYGTNRGHDSIAAYSIAENGGLTLIDIVPSSGKGPQNLAVTPDGRLLICANMPGNSVAVFRIDSQTGRLTLAGTPLAMPSPSCIRIY